MMRKTGAFVIAAAITLTAGCAGHHKKMHQRHAEHHSVQHDKHHADHEGEGCGEYCDHRDGGHKKHKHAHKYGAMLLLTSARSFDDTLNALENAIESRGMKLFTTIDHAAGAKKIDIELAPATVVLFGSPKVGTPLMQENPKVGFALPMRALVWETDGVVKIGVTNPKKVAKAFELTQNDEMIKKITTNLLEIQAEAAGSGG